MSDTTELYPVFGAYLEQFIWHDGDNEGVGYIPPFEQSASEPATPAKELVKSPRKLKRAMPDDDKENRMSPCSLWKKAKGLDDNGYDAIRNAQGAPTIRSWSSKEWNHFLKEAKRNALLGNKSPFKDTPQPVRNTDIVSREEGARRYHDVDGDDELSSLSPQLESNGGDSDADDADGVALSVNKKPSESGSVQPVIDSQQPEKVEVTDKTAGQDCTGDSSDVNGEGSNLPSSPVLNIQDVRGSDASDVDEECHVADRNQSIARRSESPQPSTASAHVEAAPHVNAKPAIVQAILRTAQTHRQKYGGKRYSPRRHVWTGKEPPRLLLPIIEREDETTEDNGGRRTRSSKRKGKSSHPEPDAAGGQNAGAAKKRTKQKRGNKRASTAKRDIEDDTQEVEDEAQDRSEGAEASGSGSNEHEEQDHTNSSNAAQTHRVEAGSNTVTETTRQEIIRDRYIEVVTTGPGLYPETELKKLSKHAQKNDDDDKICPLCGETPPMGAFMRHLKGFHGEMSYKCKQSGCGEGFKRLDSFKRHKERTGH